ncbi:MAG: histidine kinase, partial [Bacteroidota bacterium]
AELYYTKALDIQLKAGDDYARSVNLVNMAQVKIHQEAYELAKHYALEGLSLAKTSENFEGIAHANAVLGTINIHTSQYEKAKDYLNESLRYSNHIGNKVDMRETWYKLAELEEKRGNYSESLEAFKTYHAYYDTLLGEEKSKALSQLEVQYETKEKEQEIENLSQEATIQALELRQSNLNFTILGIVLIVLILGGFIYYLINQRRQLRLTQQSQNIEQRLLRSQMNPHFIFNAMTAVQRQINEGDADNADIYLTKFSRLIRQVLDNSRSEFIPLEQELEMLENYLKLHQASVKTPFQYDIEVDQNIDPEELMIPPMFAQPFVENAIEHGIKQLGAEGKIAIHFSLKKEVLMLKVEDNGVGIPQRGETTYKSHKSLATQITNERIDLFRKQMKKDISFRLQNLNPGTQVILNLPFQYA